MKTSPKHRSTLALATFASALLMLLVNDGLLKGQSVVPTWLSGKLSDFAGLIVAPVTLVLLVAARRRCTQLCCLLAVAGLFTVTEVSPACAELAQALAARVGQSWRLWPDASDLAALSVLPISWFCCRALSSASRALPRSGHRRRLRLAHAAHPEHPAELLRARPARHRRAVQLRLHLRARRPMHGFGVKSSSRDGGGSSQTCK